MKYEDIKAKEIGTILYDEFSEGIRFIIMRGPCSLCAYVGIPLAHPLAGYSYDDLPVDCHGGLTFASEGRGAWPAGYFWYGWDYAHAGDYSFFDDDYSPDSQNKKWTVEEVKEDSWSAIYDFNKLLRLSEAIRNKLRKDWRGNR